MALIENSPQNLSMLDFRAIADEYGGLIRSCRFAVQIVPVGSKILGYSSLLRDFTYLCEIAEFPGRGFMNIDVRYYGPNHKLPYQTTYEDLTLTFLCRADSEEKGFFDDWMHHINPINSFNFNYRDEYRARINIFQFAEGAETGGESAPYASYAVTCHNAYPLLVNPQPMTWGDADQFQRLIVSFTYTHWDRNMQEEKPSSFSLIKDKNSPRRPISREPYNDDYYNNTKRG